MLSPVDVACILILFVKRWARDSSALPPGPRGIPILGIVRDIPQEKPWVTFSNLSKKYGDVISFSILGQTTIVLSSASAVSDLLDKRSSIYSTRPQTGWIWLSSNLPYDNEWRLHRRLISRFFQPSAVGQWHTVQTREAHRLLKSLLADNVDLSYAVRLSFYRSLLNVAYGLPARDVGSQFVRLLSEVDIGASEAYKHAAIILPWLRRIPSWCPGGSWQGKLGEWTQLSRRTREDPFKATNESESRGGGDPSILSSLLDRVTDGNKLGTSEEVIKSVTATVFVAGADTSVDTFLAFFCAMILHPEVQKRAQDQLDAAVGPDRLPQLLSDRPSLPYVHAVIKELLRWHNVLPLGLPHSATKEDEYRGWRIPSGATVLINSWGILHDPEVYARPEAFIPDRYLKDGKMDPDVFDPAIIAFGSGRRVCPGKHFAEDSLFINIASVLYTMNIMPAVDEHGVPVPVEHKVTPGMLS
ncbi:cytochrome P450 [Cubamyces lactineus]|nr:cytochrome P450 [Cubamyces lactineus]